VLGHQQPQADEIVADLVGQQLPYASFQALRIAGLGFDPGGGPLGFQQQPGIRAIAILFGPVVAVGDTAARDGYLNRDDPP
jgi:hypothetical protein